MAAPFQTNLLDAIEVLDSTDGISFHVPPNTGVRMQEVTTDEIHRITGFVGARSHEELLGNLLDVSYIHAGWHTDNYSLEGEFFVKDIRHCLHDRILPYTDPRLPHEKQKIMDGMRVFEEAPGSGRLTALRVTTTGDPVQLWFYDANHRRLEYLDLDLHSYMDFLVTMIGVPGWQYLFTDTDLTDRELNSESEFLTTALRILPDLFPHRDYDVLHTRLEARL